MNRNVNLTIDVLDESVPIKQPKGWTEKCTKTESCVSYTATKCVDVYGGTQRSL